MVATPGKVLSLIDRRMISIASLRLFVLDEADEMLSYQGMQEQSMKIHRKLPKTCQMCLFSATYNEEVTVFAKRVIKDPKTEIIVPPQKLTITKLWQFFIQCANEAGKFQILEEVYSTFAVGQSIIFCQKRETACVLAKKMKESSFDVSLLHGGDMLSTERDKVMDSFRCGETRVLVTTNVLARGIDVLNVSLVINYDLPLLRTGTADRETYLHRVGRSARYGNSGVAINLLLPGQLTVVQELDDYFNPHKDKGPLIREMHEENLIEINQLLERII
eukprot:TRINITY_DN1391_c0_g1_i4.p1 TRINITY_DN1391_c0_g1~~TRINITY_DN1391_c0_g1_i4.p1  ORF type:complete len:276 (+),score=72.35 TRINITY_DN1391_c0_g1_i4:337-1164(+)